MRLAWVVALAAVLAAPASGSDLLDQFLEAGSDPAGGEVTSEAGTGIKQALALGVERAIAKLGVEDGFWGDPSVRIPVPDDLKSLAKAADRLGQGRYVEEFRLTMNRAAEKAIPEAAGVFGNALREMTVADAMELVRGEPV